MLDLYRSGWDNGVQGQYCAIAMKKVESTPAHPLSTMDLEVRMSPIHGLGVFARRSISSGQEIGRYAGKRHRTWEARGHDSQLTYLFGLTDGSVIDASDGGNATRHLNHACDPNCEAQEVKLRGRRIEVVFTALRDIDAGEEMFIDYLLCLDESDDPSNYPCRCGTANCRGSMADLAEI